MEVFVEFLYGLSALDDAAVPAGPLRAGVQGVQGQHQALLAPAEGGGGGREGGGRGTGGGGGEVGQAPEAGHGAGEGESFQGVGAPEAAAPAPAVTTQETTTCF